jgi:hypothetical protein
MLPGLFTFSDKWIYNAVLRGWLIHISNSPRRSKTSMSGNRITENEQPRIFQTHATLASVPLDATNIADLFAAVLDNVTDCERLVRMISKR